MSTYRLLSVSADAKTVKGEKKGWLTGILYLAPANTSGINTCAFSTPGCRAACLFTAGRAAFQPNVIPARIRKTKELFANRTQFLGQLQNDIRALQREADRKSFQPAVRLNGTSDLPWLAHMIAPLFPSIRFYDYTKIPKPWERTLSNYHLTFSLSENNLMDALVVLHRGMNVAVVFDIKRGAPLPKTWQGFPVADGDLSDLRFLDKPGTVIGVRAKGRAKKDCSGFVQSPLIQIRSAA